MSFTLRSLGDKKKTTDTAIEMEPLNGTRARYGQLRSVQSDAGAPLDSLLKSATATLNNVDLAHQSSSFARFMNLTAGLLLLASGIVIAILTASGAGYPLVGPTGIPATFAGNPVLYRRTTAWLSLPLVNGVPYKHTYIGAQPDFVAITDCSEASPCAVNGTGLEPVSPSITSAAAYNLTQCNASQPCAFRTTGPSAYDANVLSLDTCSASAPCAPVTSLHRSIGTMQIQVFVPLVLLWSGIVRCIAFIKHDYYGLQTAFGGSSIRYWDFLGSWPFMMLTVACLLDYQTLEIYILIGIAVGAAGLVWSSAASNAYVLSAMIDTKSANGSDTMLRNSAYATIAWGWLLFGGVWGVLSINFLGTYAEQGAAVIPSWVQGIYWVLLAGGLVGHFVGSIGMGLGIKAASDSNSLSEAQGAAICDMICSFLEAGTKLAFGWIMWAYLININSPYQML